MDYYANTVIGGLIDSPGLDGSFVDVIDFWLSECPKWGCTAQELSDLTAASLTAVDAALGAAAALGKVLSISSHTSLAVHPDYYHAQLDLLIKHGNGFRFWEFFTNSEDDVRSLAYETLTRGAPAHVHVTQRTLNPHWVELACYLLAAGEYSYFSYSGPWMLDSFSIFPEYTKPLGRPLGPPANASSQQPVAPWALLAGENLVINLPTAPNASGNVPGKVAFLGLQPTAAACLAAAQADAAHSAMTWVAAGGGEWSLTCWARLDAPDWGACIAAEDPGCYVGAESGHVSAVRDGFVKKETVWTRAFEHVNVTWWPANNSAVMEGW